MSNTAPGSQISSVAELLAHAYHMELEAQERYRYLAEQMEVHNNSELASLFRKLSEVEGIHAKDILQQMQSMNVSQPAAAAGDRARSCGTYRKRSPRSGSSGLGCKRFGDIGLRARIRLTGYVDLGDGDGRCLGSGSAIAGTGTR